MRWRSFVVIDEKITIVGWWNEAQFAVESQDASFSLRGWPNAFESILIRRMKLFFTFALATSVFISADAAKENLPDKSNVAATEVKWISFPDQRLEVRGLPWLKENAPDLWRLPKSAKDKVPKGVWNRAVAPDGGRICFSSESTRLAIKIQAAQGHGKPCFFDAYVNGQYAGSANAKGTNETAAVLFEKKERAPKEITVYFPNNGEARLLAVGLDADAEIKTAPAFALKKPMVCYGSSVMQGSGATHPAKTYPAALARRLNLDFVNLGFGGAGKAEAEVVELVNQLDGCCYIFDLGKSYGTQPMEPYAKMLDAIRAAHPTAPIICVTPIYSTKEVNEPSYRERSENLRVMMRQAATERRKAGDKFMFVVEGLELFGAADKELLHDPAHPNDEGNELIAQRLAPIIEKILFGKGAAIKN